MFTLRTWLSLVMLLLWLVPTGTQAQTAGTSLLIEPTPGGATLNLSCPQPGAQLRVLVNNQPARVTALSPARDLPPAVALIIEHSAAMEGFATPLRTRRSEAELLALRVHELAPHGTSLSLIAVTPDGATMLDIGGQGRPRFAPSAVRGAPDLVAGLALAQQVLGQAPPGPRLIVVVLATEPTVWPTQTALAGARLLVMSLTAEQNSDLTGSLADLTLGLGGQYLPYQTRSLAERERLQVGLDGYLRAALQPGIAQHLRLTELAPGEHQLTLMGCGQPVTSSLRSLPGASSPVPMASLGALAAGLGLGWLLHRGTRPVAAPGPAVLVEPLPLEEQTTIQQTRSPLEPGLLRLVVWDGQGRREQLLAGRQWLVGRDVHCSMPLEGEGVAPLHVRLALIDQELEITALDGVVTLGSPLSQPLAHGAPEPLSWGELVCLGATVRLMVERVR